MAVQNQQTATNVNLGGQPGRIPLATRGRGQQERYTPNDADVAPETPYDPSLFQPTELFRNSVLMLREPKGEKTAPTCWFEPLGYCRDGLNSNGWCQWHLRHLFNCQPTTEYTAVNYDNKIKLLAYTKPKCYIPMPFEVDQVGVIPIIEMYDSIEEIENNTIFGVLQYTLMHSGSKYSEEQRNRIVKEHKAYFLLMLEASTSNAALSRKNIPIEPTIRINTDACVRYVSSKLWPKSYDIHLQVMDATTNTLQRINVRSCTAFTQSILLQCDLAYVYVQKLNVMLCNSPAFSVNDRMLVVDETKMSEGTYQLQNGTCTIGSPYTAAIYRNDIGGEVSFLTRDYKRSSQVCTRLQIDNKNLLQYTEKPSTS